MVADPVIEYMSTEELSARIDRITADMVAAAKKTEFIEAARLRDELVALKALLEQKTNSVEA